LEKVTTFHALLSILSVRFVGVISNQTCRNAAVRYGHSAAAAFSIESRLWILKSHAFVTWSMAPSNLDAAIQLPLALQYQLRMRTMSRISAFHHP
jgi:hypothetical protein